MKLVDEMIARVQCYHIIRVRGTPASGKTTVMQLVANKLLGKYGQTTPIHTLSGWNKNVVKEATGWNAYLKQETGTGGDKWPTYPAYLLLDEAQQSYWDDQLGQISSKLSSPSWAARSSYSFHRTAHRIGVLRALTKSISKFLWSLPLNSRFHCDQTKALATTCRSQCGPVKAPSFTLVDRLACCLMRMKQ